MGQDIALAGQIDTEHRPRQYLRYRSFRHDLRFLRHALKCLQASKIQPNHLIGAVMLPEKIPRSRDASTTHQ